MAVDIETTSFVTLPLDKIVSRLSVRRISASGVARLQESMRWAGFLDNYPLTVIPLEDGYQLIDGNHRYEAAKGLGIVLVPCVIKTELTEAELYQIAMQSNSAAETVVPSTLVTYAEFIWARLAEVDERDPELDPEKKRKKYTQSDIGKMLGWGRDRIKDYAALRKICPEAWRIVGSTFEKIVPSNGNTIDPTGGSTPPFTENLLSTILDLTPEQQTELVTEFTSNPNFSKGKFKSLAESYQTRNEMHKYALKQLGDLGDDYTAKLKEEVYSGAYDSDWTPDNHPKLDKLIQAIRDAWESKNSTRLIHGDFYEEVKNIGDGSIDLIVTDPPYNVASNREFTNLKKHKDLSQDFGEWDKYDFHEFIKLFPVWASEWKRILRDQGSGYVFTSPEYCSYLWRALEEAGLCVKTILVWYKPNPPQQVIHTTYKNSVEYIIFFTKGEGGHTFHWGDENEMQNHINIPVCSGNERLKNAKGDVLHPTQKPIALLKHLIHISSNGGDTIFDGFMGVGSVGAACKGKNIQRKFIGIEQDKTFFDAAQRRLAE